jgi:[ribosomal protein S5]-alanine N-acetyltransferase
MMLPAPMQRGPRVQLAFPRLRDQHEVIALSRASRSLHRGWASPPATPEQFARVLARTRRSDFAALLIRRLEDNAILGAIEISQIVRGGFRSAYLGYQIGAPWARQGYMTEALGLALAYGFRTLGLHRLEANIQPDNVPSIALVRQLGFTHEGYSRRYLKIGGRWRDHERWAILAEDWRARRSDSSRRRRDHPLKG